MHNKRTRGGKTSALDDGDLNECWNDFVSLVPCVPLPKSVFFLLTSNATANGQKLSLRSHWIPFKTQLKFRTFNRNTFITFLTVWVVSTPPEHCSLWILHYVPIMKACIKLAISHNSLIFWSHGYCFSLSWLITNRTHFQLDKHNDKIRSASEWRHKQSHKKTKSKIK